MDRSITRKDNPADRLDDACAELADYKCEESNLRQTYHLVLLIEALRDQAERDEMFAHALHQAAERTERRLQHTAEAA